jgi:hypothetical protein
MGPGLGCWNPLWKTRGSLVSVEAAVPEHLYVPLATWAVVRWWWWPTETSRHRLSEPTVKTPGCETPDTAKARHSRSPGTATSLG